MGQSSEQLQKRDGQGRRLHWLFALQGPADSREKRSQTTNSCPQFADVDDQELAGSEMIINPLYQHEDTCRIIVAHKHSHRGPSACSSLQNSHHSRTSTRHHRLRDAFWPLRCILRYIAFYSGYNLYINSTAKSHITVTPKYEYKEFSYPSTYNLTVAKIKPWGRFWGLVINGAYSKLVGGTSRNKEGVTFEVEVQL